MRDALTMQSVHGEELTGQVIGCFFTTYNDLGFGLPESVYSAALSVLFDGLGLHARREHLVDVMFRNVRVGSFRLDYLIEDRLVLELKAGHLLPPGSKAQLLTYMRASKRKLGLLLFYGPTPEIERVTL